MKVKDKRIPIQRQREGKPAAVPGSASSLGPIGCQGPWFLCLSSPVEAQGPECGSRGWFPASVKWPPSADGPCTT